MHPSSLLQVFALCCCVAAADQDCPEGKIWNECGSACPLTCDNYQDPPGCIAVCVPGCFCPEGKVQSGEVCVVPEDCPRLPSAFDLKCPEGRVWNNCGTACPLTCDNFRDPPICTRQCVPGCFCLPGTVMDREGNCVPANQCPDPGMQCPEGREWNNCGTACPLTCDNFQDPPICTKQCVPGCVCPPDTVVDREGNCVPPDQCPEFKLKCPPGKVWDNCGSPCPVTCDNFRNPPVCTCVPGCFCPPDTVMDHEGHCMSVRQCPEEESTHEEL